MTPAELPGWAAVTVTALSVAGAALTLLGAAGLIRLRTFFDRVHAPTLGSTLGIVLILIGSALYFAVAHQRYLPREILIWLFVTITTPVGLILLARATLFRERVEAAGGVEGEVQRAPPPKPEPKTPARKARPKPADKTAAKTATKPPAATKPAAKKAPAKKPAAKNPALGKAAPRKAAASPRARKPRGG